MILQRMKTRALKSTHFPKEAMYLFNELDEILDKKFHLLIAKNIPEVIFHLIYDIYRDKYIKQAIKEAQKDMIIYNAIFVGNIRNPSIEKIKQFLPQLELSLPTLSEITIELISKAKKYQDLNNLQGYELIGLLAYFFLGLASKITDFEYIRANISKLTTVKKVTQIQTKNSSLTIKYCFLSSEAILLAKKLYFEDKHKTLIETAKYLIDETKKKTINETKLNIVPEVLKENAIKAVKVRHQRTNELKKQAINEYKTKSEYYKKLGKVLSKNDFARKFALAHELKYETVRKNWLQGI